jgi:hypothetical protein
MMPDLTISFEDLPLYQDAFLTTGYVTGSAVVSYDEDDLSDWTVERIELEAYGPPLISRGPQTAVLTSEHPLWNAIEAALKPRIEAAIEEATPYVDPNAEHRLSASQLGVGRYGTAG